MLTGDAPFDGETMPALMRQHLTVEPVPPSQKKGGIPSDLDRLVLGLLTKNPADRPSSAEDVAKWLRAIAAGQPQFLPPVPAQQFAQPAPVPQTPQPWPVAGAPAPAMGYAPPPPVGPQTVPSRRGSRRGFCSGSSWWVARLPWAAACW